MEVTRAPVGSPFHRAPESWPWRSHLELGAYRSAAGSARGHVASVLREWGLRELVETTEIVVSELVANSVLATEAVRWLIRPPVRLWLLSDGAGALVHVWDAIPAAPEPRAAGPDDESGRGLVIVAALSAQVGASPAAGQAGREAHLGADHRDGRERSPMSRHACSCGFTASGGDELAEHLGEMFIPADDIGADGVPHAEDGRDVPGRACLCGFTGPDATALDEHLLAVFRPADEIGRDRRRHAARPA